MRAVSVRSLVACLVYVGCLLPAGCQSWSQMGQGIPTGSRVAPPGTGSYPVPSSYYNGQKSSSTAAAGLTSNLAQTGPGSPPSVANSTWQPPTIDQLRGGVDNVAQAAISDAATASSQVVQASTSRAASALQQFTDPVASAPIPSDSINAVDSDPLPPSFSNSRSISDTAPASAPLSSQVPQLDWQNQR